MATRASVFLQDKPRSNFLESSAVRFKSKAGTEKPTNLISAAGTRLNLLVLNRFPPTR